MQNGSFVKSPEELKYLRGVQHEGAKFYMQEKMQAFWTVDEALARHVLPPHMEPLMPFGKPVVLAYISFFGRPEYLYPYTEGALFMLAQCEGVGGVYTFAMPLDGNDQAMDSGRQYFGYPKKQAYVKMERRGDKVRGYIERNDIRIFELQMTIGEQPNDPVLGPQMLGPEGPQTEDGYVLLLKYDMDSVPDARYDHCFRRFRIQAQNNFVNFREKRNGRVDKMVFQPSEDDPWMELAPQSPEDILGAIYCKYDTTMKGSQLLYTYDDAEYEAVLPYAFPFWDTVLLGKEHSSHRTESFWR